MNIKKIATGVAVIAVGCCVAVFLFIVRLVFWSDIRDYVAPQEFTVEQWRRAGPTGDENDVVEAFEFSHH